MLQCFFSQQFRSSPLNNTCLPFLAPFFMNWLPWWHGSQFRSSTSQSTVLDAMSTKSRQFSESGEWLAFSEPWQTFLSSSQGKLKKKKKKVQRWLCSSGPPCGRGARKTAEKNGLFLILLIVLRVSRPGSRLWAGPALDEAIEGPCLFPSPHSLGIHVPSWSSPLQGTEDQPPAWLVFAFVWDVRVKRECWGQPRVSDLGVWRQAQESVFELFPWWFWRAPGLRNKAECNEQGLWNQTKLSKLLWVSVCPSVKCETSGK